MSSRVAFLCLLVAIAMTLTAAPSIADHGTLAAEKRTCREFGTVRPGSVVYAGPSNLGVYCTARKNDKRYGVIGYHSREKAKRGARVICRWYSAGVVRRGKTVVVSPEPGFYRMGWLARRLNGTRVCNG